MAKRKTANDVYELCLKIEKHVLVTNGKVLRNFWIATSALSVSSFIAGALMLARLF